MILFVFLLGVVAHAGVNEELAPFHLRIDSPEKWSITKNSEMKSGEKRIRTMELSFENVVVELSLLNTLTSEQAKQEANIEYSSVLSAYKASITPYEGAVSNKLSCGKPFEPRDLKTEFAGTQSRTLLGYASERKTFGACTTEEAKMEFAFTTAYLPGNWMLKLTAFRKRDKNLNVDYWKKLMAHFKVQN